MADGAEQVAAAVARLLEDDALAGRLAASARRLVEDRYTWERSVERLEEAYRRALEAR